MRSNKKSTLSKLIESGRTRNWTQAGLQSPPYCFIPFFKPLAHSFLYLRESPRDSSSFLVNLWPPHDLLATLEEDQGRKLLGEGGRAHFVPAGPRKYSENASVHITPSDSPFRPSAQDLTYRVLTSV